MPSALGIGSLDSGLLHALLGIQSQEQLITYPRLGASWEGFALEEIIKKYHAQPEECFFWATQSGAEELTNE